MPIRIKYVAESNRERIAFGPLLITVLFLALKKMVFLKKKILPKKKNIFFYLFSMQLFSADATMFSIFFFDHKKLKKPPSKVAHNRPKPFLRQSSPGHSPQPRSSFPFYKKSIATLSLLLSD